MEKALEAVQKNLTSVTTAANKFNVPRKTLDDRVKGRVVHGRKSGPGTILTPAEEDILCNYLIYMAQRGFPLTMKMVMAYAWSLAKKSAAGLVPSHLADIFCTPHREDENRPKRRRLTNARVLTEKEYYDMLKEKKQKEKEEQEAKERRKNEREKHKKETGKIKKKREEEKRKKKEIEEEKQRKREKERRKKKKQEEKNGKRKMKIAHTEEHSSTDEDEELNCPPSRPSSSRVCRLPAAVAVFDSFISDSTDTDDSGVLCGLCNEREPQNCGKKIVYGSTVISVELDFILDLPKNIFVGHVIDYLRYHYCFFQV